MDYIGLSEISGSLIVFEGVENPVFDEIVEIKVDGYKDKLGKVVQIFGDKAIVQVFQGTHEL